MQAHDASRSELQQAKALLIREIPLAESSESDIAEDCWTFETGVPLDEPILAARRYLTSRPMKCGLRLRSGSVPTTLCRSCRDRRRGDQASAWERYRLAFAGSSAVEFTRHVWADYHQAS